MNRIDFESIIEGLYNYYGKPVNKKQIDNWFGEFVDVYPSVLIKAIEAVKHNPTINAFPSPNIIWRAIHEVRAAEWNKKKAEEQSVAHQFWKIENKTACGLSALMLIKGMFEHKMNASQLVEQMYHEEQAFPNVGWAQNADALNSFLDYYHEPDQEKRRIKKLEMERLEKICDAIQ